MNLTGNTLLLKQKEPRVLTPFRRFIHQIVLRNLKTEINNNLGHRYRRLNLVVA